MWHGLTNSPLLALWHLQVNYSLGFLLESRSEDIYRMKGILSIAGSEHRFVYQVRGQAYRVQWEVKGCYLARRKTAEAGRWCWQIRAGSAGVLCPLRLH